MDFIKHFDTRISLSEERLRFVKGMLEILEYINNDDFEKTSDNELIFTKFKNETANGDYHKILSLCSLTLVSKIELYIISKHSILSKYEWEKSYFTRLAIMNIYETINSYNKYAKDIKVISENKNHLTTSFLELGKKLKDFKKENNFQTKMSVIRNTTIAHIDINFDKYYNEVKSVDLQKTIPMIKNFISLLDEIFDFSLGCLRDNSKPIDIKGFDNFYNNVKEIFDKNIR